MEPWKSVAAQVFDHWDLWFLVALVVDHRVDWRALRGRLLERVKGHGWDREDAEAKLSHLADLQRRVARCEVHPTVLVRSESRDKRLVTKARDKLFKQHVEDRYKTRAMRETPRRLLRARAMRGHSSRFPVSPARFEKVFNVVRGPGGHHHAERASFGDARRMERDLARADKSCKGETTQRLALYRAFLTVHLDLIARSDDSCGVLGDLFREGLAAYIAIDWQATGMRPDSYLRDFLELATWKDYGGIDDLGGFFAGLAPPTKIKTVLADILSRRQAGVVREKLAEWISWARRSRLKPFKRVAATIRKHFENVVAIVSTGLNNGPIEGLNGKIRTITRGPTASTAPGVPSASSCSAAPASCSTRR